MNIAKALLPAILLVFSEAHGSGSNQTLTQPMEEYVRIAKEDLSQRLDVAGEELELVRHEEVTWRDGSLGCPSPGMSYTQSLVNGTLIVLRFDGVDYHYHAGGRRTPFYCPTPEPPLPSGSVLGDT